MASSPALGLRPVAVRPPGGGVPSLRGPQPAPPRQPALPGFDGPPPGPARVEVPAARVGAAAPQARAAEELHPALWRAHQLGRAAQAVLGSGFPELDAHLPGGGWPAGTLTELLLPHEGVGELRLLAPVLAAVQQQQQRSVMWFDPPASPCAWALAALDIDLQQLVVVRSRAGARGRAREHLPAPDILWALEHALKSGHVGAVLAWLPARLPADALRRLQLAAQAHEGPAFLLRGVQARNQPSAAPLRLLLASAGPDTLRLLLFKRRGPPLAQPIDLALPTVLSEPARARAEAGRGGDGGRPPPAPAAACGSPLEAGWR